MIVVSCDTCRKEIVRDDGGWFGVDYQAPPVPIPPDDDGTLYLSELVLLGQDHEFHFCSPLCLQTWSFEREFTPQPLEGTA